MLACFGGLNYNVLYSLAIHSCPCKGTASIENVALRPNIGSLLPISLDLYS